MLGYAIGASVVIAFAFVARASQAEVPALRPPLTLQYVFDEELGVACHLKDAGVPGTDEDFVATCESSPTKSDTWSSYDAMPWQSTGCYAARADGLWYFETCPTSAAALDAPSPAGATLITPARPPKSANDPAWTEVAGGDSGPGRS